MNTLLMHCRPGLEGEVCAEIAEHTATLEIPGYAKSKPASAHVEFICQDTNDTERLMRRLRFADLIFPRQWARGPGFIELPESQRIEVLLVELASYPVCDSLWLEVLGTNAGREVPTFCRKFEKPLRAALVKAGRLQEDPALPHPLLTSRSGREVFVGLAEPCNSALWPVGIPRLKFPREALSRSTPELEETRHQFIPRGKWDKRLAPDMLAMDFGTAPGGWAWQPVNWEMRVTTVDNGPMAENLMYPGPVDHQKVDGYQYCPRRWVDWMVCDIVEKSARIGALIETWIGEGLCREAVVNLKLPMKQRYARVRKIFQRLRESFDARGLKVAIGCKQLYHDREEVTCHLHRLER